MLTHSLSNNIQGRVQLGALLNPTPVGYELLKDSDGIALKDSDGKYIYVLKE